VAGHRLAIDALGLFGEPLDEGRAIGDLALRLGQRLALLGGEDRGEVLLEFPSSARTSGAGRSRGPCGAHLAQAFCAFSAAFAMASAACARPSEATRAITSPRAGFVTSMVAPSAASTQSPAR
jgi:hypothetical protein